MAFNIGNGLAEMGRSVAQTAQAWTLEAQKAEAQKEMLTLADQLAGAREDKGRQFAKSEREATQGWQSGEKDKDRTFQASEGDKTRATQITTAGIAAGATIRSQQISSEARLKEAEMLDRYRRDELDVNKGLKERELETPEVRAFREREKMTPHQREEYDRFVASKKEPKTPYEFHANDGNPVIINKQTGEVMPGSPAGSAPGGKRLETSERKQLKEMADPAISLSDLTSAFKPSFGGALTEATGNAANAFARNFSMASPDAKDAASWWQQYQRFSNLEQNKLYGAALSAMEQENFKKAMVTPNMSSDMIKRNLEIQQDIALTALSRYASSLLKDGYKPDSIEAITGLRFYSDKAYASFPPGTIYIAPNGKVMRKQATPGNY